jgi:hypothetical protein
MITNPRTQEKKVFCGLDTGKPFGHINILDFGKIYHHKRLLMISLDFSIFASNKYISNGLFTRIQKICNE